MSSRSRRDADVAETLSKFEEATAPEESAPTLAMGPGDTLVGLCLDAAHPTLRGRVLVAIETPLGSTKRWLPTLQGLAIRVQDRVLLTKPQNFAEPIVTGVVDGFARRPEVPKEEGARVTLARDEAVRIVSADGQPLVEVSEGDRGPVVKLLAEDADIALAGDLRVRAKSIALVATEGEARVRAEGDVVIEGENIHLN